MVVSNFDAFDWVMIASPIAAYRSVLRGCENDTERRGSVPKNLLRRVDLRRHGGTVFSDRRTPPGG